MKAGYKVIRLEYCKSPLFIEVINFEFSNEVYTVFWKTFEKRNSTDTIGVWKIKQLKN